MDCTDPDAFLSHVIRLQEEAAARQEVFRSLRGTDLTLTAECAGLTLSVQNATTQLRHNQALLQLDETECVQIETEVAAIRAELMVHYSMTRRHLDDEHHLKRAADDVVNQWDQFVSCVSRVQKTTK